jgi:phosphonate transport system substrate-binding protein
MPDDHIPSSRRRAAFAFAVVSREPRIRAALEGLCTSLSGRLDVLLYPQLARGYGELSVQLATGGIDLAWAPPLVAGELVKSGTASVLVCTRRSSASLYHSAFFTGRESGIHTVAELRGRRIAWVDRSSASGFLIPRLWMQQSGLELEGFFSRELFAGTHEAVVRAVVAGEADAGATFAELEPRSRKVVGAGWVAVVDPACIEVIGIAGAVPADAITASRRVSPGAQAALTEALLNLSDDERALVREIFRSEGFERCMATYLGSLARLAGQAA